MSRSVRSFPLSLAGLVLAAAACGGTPPEPTPSGADAGVAPSSAPPAIAADTSRVRVQQGPRVQLAHAESSIAFRDLPTIERADVGDPEPREDEQHEHEVHRIPWPHPREAFATKLGADPTLQSAVPIRNMPSAIKSFLGQGHTNSQSTITGTPPDTNGAVGPNHYVQTVNGGLEIWNKSGTVARSSVSVSALFTGYVGTNTGNGCAANNDGDPVVVYDQLADRWFITQFSLPNANSAPNFQCVAVSKTADPTGAYWLYDFSYAALNDYGKFGIWPDAYYATFNNFVGQTFSGAELCAYDRVKMLAGQPATQQCFQQDNTVGGAQPISLDGPIKPPAGEPGFFVQFDYNTNPPLNKLDFWKLHVDWATPANTKLTGPTVVTVTAFTPTCAASTTGDCIPSLPAGALLAGLDDRLMFRFSYRNFGTHEAVFLNHSVVAGATGGIRWYEIRDPNGALSLFQEGTYAPADGNWRWMGSFAQDMAQDMALGFGITSATTNPSIAWTGRLPTDPVGTMGQGESIVAAGTGHEVKSVTRWGDYSNMTVDPVDDCTFWYTQEYYLVSLPSSSTWETQIASVKFPRCGANNFGITLAPATRSVAKGASTTYTVTTTLSAGAAESIALNIQDLPAGVTAAFAPATVSAGATSTLTLTASAAAPASPATTFTVIGKTPSAVHAASAQLVVGVCVPITTCPAPDNCGTISDTCGGTLTCGACVGTATCVANVCVGGLTDAGTDAGGTDAGGTDAGGTDAGKLPDSGPGPGVDSGPGDIDSGAGDTDSGSTGPGPGGDSGAGSSGGASDAAADSGSSGGGGSDSGCGCRTAAGPSSGNVGLFGGTVLALAALLRRRRRR